MDRSDATRPNQGPPGVPAITPTRVSTAPAVPAFAAEDAAAFVAAHGVGGIRIGTAGPWAVEAVEFIPERELQARFATGTGAAEDTLRCLVTVRGIFAVAALPIPGRERRVGVAHQAYVVFDAHTGNSLLRVLGPTERA